MSAADRIKAIAAAAEAAGAVVEVHESTPPGGPLTSVTIFNGAPWYAQVGMSYWTETGKEAIRPSRGTRRTSYSDIEAIAWTGDR